MGNVNDKSKLKYTLCGVPVPTVKWGYIEANTKNLINATKRPFVDYAYDYLLPITSGMCGKVIHFKAAGYNNKTLSWNTTHKTSSESFL